MDRKSAASRGLRALANSTALIMLWMLGTSSAFAQAGVVLQNPGAYSGTIGHNKGAVEQVTCPAGYVLRGVKHVDRRMDSTQASARGMTTQVSLYCARISVGVGGTVNVINATPDGTPTVEGYSYADAFAVGTVEHRYCPAGQIVHRLGGHDRLVPNGVYFVPWASSLTIGCRPLMMSPQDWVVVDTAVAGTPVQAGVNESNAPHTFRGYFGTGGTDYMITGVHRQAGGEGWDGINVYDGLLLQARHSAVMTFTDFAWDKTLGGAGWLVNLLRQGALLDDGAGVTGANKTPYASGAANDPADFAAASEIYVRPNDQYRAGISQRPAGVASNTYLTSGSCVDASGITLANRQDASCTLAVTGLPDIGVGITTPAPTYNYMGHTQNVTVTATNFGPGATDGDDGFTLVTTVPAGWAAGTLPANCTANVDRTVVTCALDPLAAAASPGLAGGTVSFTIPVIAIAPPPNGVYAANVSLGRTVPDGDADASNDDYNTANDNANGPLVYLAPAAAGGQCRISGQGADSGVPFALGSFGAQVIATTSGANWDAAVVGSLTFQDALGVWHTGPANGLWRSTGSAASLTFTFSQPVPASWIGIALVDVGTAGAAGPYAPTYNVTVAGAATPADFTMSPIRLNAGVMAQTLAYGGGVITKSQSSQDPAESGLLRGTSERLVSSITISSANLLPGDSIGYQLLAIPSCITIAKVSQGGTGSFDIASTNVSAGDGTPVANTTLTTTAAGTPVSGPLNFAAAIGSPVVLTEAVPSGWVLGAAACSDRNAALNGNPGSFGTLSGNTLTVPGANVRVDSDIVCTFVNDVDDGSGIVVTKDLAAESGTQAGVAEAGEQLSYTLSLTNSSSVPASNHAFYEVLPANTTLVSISGSGVTSDCAPGDAGSKLCTITVAGPIAGNGGSATVGFVVMVDNPLPVGVTQILNLVTNNTTTPPPGCDPATQVCTPPPSCDPLTDPGHCVSIPVSPANVTVAKKLTAESGTQADIAEAGEQLTYTLTVTNNGGAAASNHEFFEVLPANTTLISISGAGVTSNCAPGDAGTKLCTITVAGPIAGNGGTAIVTVGVIVASPLPAGVTQIANIVTDNTTTPPTGCDPATQVCTTPPSCDPSTDPAHCVVTPVAPANVTVAKALTIGGPTAESGEQLTYTLTLTNSGSASATNHSFYEVLPANTTLVLITGTGVTSNCAPGDAGTKLCTITVAGPIAGNGGRATATVIVTVANPLPAGVTQIANIVTDSTTTPPTGCDPATQVCATPPTCDPATDPAHCVVTPVTPANVTVAKALTIGGPTAESGEQLTYTLTVTNNGGATASNHAFYEVLPANTTLVSISGTGVTSNCAAGDAGTKLCTITVAGPIAGNGGTATATVIVTVANPLPAGVTQIVNIVTDDTTTPPTGCDPATQVCTTPPTCDPATDPTHCVVAPITPPNVTVAKALTAESGTQAGAAEAGEQLTYTLTLTNSGSAAASNHAFFEVLPVNTTLVSISGTGVTSNCAAGDAGAKLCTITVAGPIAGNGGTATATVIVTVANPLPAGVTQIANIVTDNTTTPPTGCDPATQACATPPSCDPSTDPAHCVVTPVTPVNVTVLKTLTAESGTVSGAAEAGEQLTYTLTVTNSGSASATNHSFYEVLPVNTTLVSIGGTGVTSNCAAGDAGAKLCTITVAGPIAGNGGTATATVVVMVANPLPAGVTQIVNLATDNTTTPPTGCDPVTQACTTPPSCDPATDPTHCVVTPVTPADVTVAKALTAESGTQAGVAEAGEQLTYTLTVTNSGSAAASNHAFFEVLPVNTTLVSIGGTGVTSNCAAGDVGTKLCTITVAGPIAGNGGTATATVIVTVANPLPAGVTQIANIVTDTTTTPPTGCDPATQVCATPPTCDPATDPDHCVVTPVTPDVRVRKALTGGGPTASPGEQLTYTLTLTNPGDTEASNHTFFEVLPANTTLVSISGTGVTSNCSAGDVGTKLCTITVAGPIAGNGGTATVTVIVTVANPLLSGVTQIVNLATDNTTTPPTGCDPATQQCTIPPPTGCDPATQVCTTPPVCDPATDPDHCVVTPVTPDVRVRKALTDGGPTASPGEQLTYTLTLTNPGDTEASNHAFFEVLPANTTLVSIGGAGVTSNCAAGDAGGKLCTITVAGPIAANGGTATATVVVTVDATLPAGTTQIVNLVTDNTTTPPTGCDPATQQCTTTPPTCDPATQVCTTPPVCDPATDPDHCVVTPVAPDVRVRKALTGGGPTASPGEQLTYTLTLTNLGGTDASNHAFYEIVPAHTTLVSIAGDGVTSNCAAGDAGGKLCTITVAGPIAANGGTATATMVVTVANPLPAGVTQIVNLATDTTTTPPTGCDPATQQCTTPPPADCDPTKQVCTTPPVCDPATDPDHCVVTPVAPDVRVRKALTGGGPTASPGEQLTYTLTLTNLGGTEARNHAFYEIVPTHTTLVSIAGNGVTSNCAAGDAGGKLCTITVAGPIAANGGTAVATVVVTVADALPIEATRIVNLVTDTTVTPPTGCDPATQQCTTTPPGCDPATKPCTTPPPACDPSTQACTTPEVCDPATDPNHCVVTPVERKPTTLTIEKRGSVQRAEIGDAITYTLRVRNVGEEVAVRPVIVDRLPAGFRLIDGQVRVRGATLLALEGAPGAILRISVDRIDPDAEVAIEYRVRIGVGSLEGDGVNRAQAECRTSATATVACSNEGRWKVDVTAGVFSEEGGIVGQVFVDCNYNSMKDEEELGIPGVRLYLEDGTYLISDVEGKYSVWGLRPTSHVLKVDATTLPTRSRLVTSSSRNLGDANSLFIDLKKGEMHRADFIEGSCNNEVVEQVKARRAQGEVRSVESEAGQPPLRFKEKGQPQSNPLQQGTDSADQIIERPRSPQGPDDDGDDREPASR